MSGLKLIEDKRTDLIRASKKADNYSASNREFGKNRFERRLKSKVSNSVKEFNSINMDKFFKEDTLDVNILVKGETNDYSVTIKFTSVLENIREEMSKLNDEFNIRCIMRGLVTSFNSDDIYVHCSCPDWCLHEDTEIKLLNGNSVKVKDMKTMFDNGEELWVYSTDASGDFKPGKVKDVWVSGFTKELVEVTLDNGKKIITTPNHRYMMRDGSYKEASELSCNDSLMPLYFKLTDGYESVKINSTAYPTKYVSVYKTVANEELAEEIESAKVRSGEDTIAIHHGDFNKLNNYPSNLKPMGVLEHYKYHSNHVRESGVLDKWLNAGKEYWSKEDNRKKQADVMRNVMKEYYANASQEELDAIKAKIYTDDWRKKIGDSNKAVWENYTEEEYKKRCDTIREVNNRPEMKELHKNIGRNMIMVRREKAGSDEAFSKELSAISKKTWAEKRDSYIKSEKYMRARHNSFQYERAPETTRKMNLTKIGKCINKIIEAGEIPSPETYNKYKSNGCPKFTKIFKDWNEVSEHFNLNHKVTNVRTIVYDTEVPVYDISVEKYNNFYVSAGCVLHNCYRFAYWSTKSNTNAFEGEQFSNGKEIRNPNDTKGRGCKHVLLVLNNNSWLMKVASVIYNYVNYMKNHFDKLYADVIYPAIYGKEYEGDVQTSLFDDDDLTSSQDELDVVNKWAREKNLFKKGNTKGVRFTKKEEPDDKQFDFDSLASNED